MGRRRKSKRRRKAVALLATVAVLSVALGAGLLFWNLSSGGGPKTAAIVDQLSLTQPDPTFAEAGTSIIEEAGYVVDYYPGEEVTVDFYRNLPAHDYDLIILRVHSGMVTERLAETGQETQREYVSLFTGEPYSPDKYPQEQIGRLGKAEYYEGAPPLFGIAPDFITRSMRGRFEQTVVILMGCDGLRSHETAEAFLHKGARAFVSWSGPVSAAHTDAATERLLQHLLIGGLTIGEAITQTMAEVGPDPSYHSTLLVYPSEEAAPAAP